MNNEKGSITRGHENMSSLLVFPLGLMHSLASDLLYLSPFEIEPAAKRISEFRKRLWLGSGSSTCINYLGSFTVIGESP